MDNYLNKILGERYEMQELIGVGGMSVVYKAYDRVDDRVVAVKILKDEFLANEEFRLRFKNESKVISMLSHPNIVKVYDVSFGEKLQYIVMEHVEGITLKEYIEMQRVLDWKEALHFVVQILRALQHAHDKGIIHRDIKPQNILLLPNANIKVTDFGIARFNRSEKNISESGAIGSVRYMSPEQARGEQTDGRADIYAVGVVLYEMLTGKLPFDAENDVSVALMQMRADAVKPSEINSSVPKGLEQITMRAMRKDPCERYQTAAEFLLDLDEFKRNPQMEFDYTYFLDQSPTKYVDTRSVTASQMPVRITDEEDDEDDSVQTEEENDSAENPQKKMIPILAGIAAALVVIVGLIVALAFADPIRELMGVEKKPSDGSSFISKLDVFGWFSKDIIEVPNFINMDYNEALEKYPDLAIENPPQYVYNSQYEDGHVCDQSPGAGEKVSGDTVIKLTVVTSSSMILIKDVTGLNYVEAETILRSEGLKVELVPTPDDSKDENTVLSTVPSVNTYIAYDGTVYVYYASNTTEEGSVRVPSVVGDELAIAKAKIVAQGLRVGAITYESSSEQLKDFVIGQNPSGYNTTKSGTYVNLVVGNGIPASNTVTFSINLPTAAEGHGSGTIKTYLNNNCYDIINDVTFNGGRYQLSFTGSGADNTFKIYADTSLICTGKVDFTTDTPTFSEISSYPYYLRESVPDVTGMNETQARAELNRMGFKNITVKTQASDTVAEGRVISQTPVSSTLTTYSNSTNITLVISSGASHADEPVSNPNEPTTLPFDETTTYIDVVVTTPFEENSTGENAHTQESPEHTVHHGDD